MLDFIATILCKFIVPIRSLCPTHATHNNFNYPSKNILEDEYKVSISSLRIFLKLLVSRVQVYFSPLYSQVTLIILFSQDEIKFLIHRPAYLKLFSQYLT